MYFKLCGAASPQTEHTTLSSTPYRQLENQAPKTTGGNQLYNTLELLMMGIMVPETCWASNKIYNKKNSSVASSWHFISTYYRPCTVKATSNLYFILFVTPHFYLSVTVIDAVNLRGCKRHNCYNFVLACDAVVLRDSGPPSRVFVWPFAVPCDSSSYRAVNNSKVATERLLSRCFRAHMPISIGQLEALFRPHQLYDSPFVEHTSTPHVITRALLDSVFAGSSCL
jgi:hypothetical protein